LHAACAHADTTVDDLQDIYQFHPASMHYQHAGSAQGTPLHVMIAHYWSLVPQVERWLEWILVTCPELVSIPVATEESSSLVISTHNESTRSISSASTTATTRTTSIVWYPLHLALAHRLPLSLVQRLYIDTSIIDNDNDNEKCTPHHSYTTLHVACLYAQGDNEKQQKDSLSLLQWLVDQQPQALTIPNPHGKLPWQLVPSHLEEVQRYLEYRTRAGKYLFVSNRCGIAHAREPILTL
jgi:hypothetical protein